MVLLTRDFILLNILLGIIEYVYFTSAILLDAKIIPLLLTTWPYEDPVKEGWKVLTSQNGTALDAIESTGTTCEQTQCRHSVGPGAKPDESGETTLDAMIMDGDTHNVGAVGGLRRISNAISVARHVLENTEHTLLVGESATEFAVNMGFKEESLTSNYSLKQWNDWRANQCQPNFWANPITRMQNLRFSPRQHTVLLAKEDQYSVAGKIVSTFHTKPLLKRNNVSPDPKKSCGPYQPIRTNDSYTMFVSDADIGFYNHDTIGMIAVDDRGSVASGTSTNGLTYKIHGRVGDSPIPGAGSYADSEIGAAACTGNGDIMMRFLPSYQTVQLMGTGLSPTAAAAQAIKSIKKKFRDFSGAIIAANKYGEYGAACNKWTDFAITVINNQFSNVSVQNITCM